MRRRLDRVASALFAPGEQVLATVGGWTRLPGLRWLGRTLISTGTGYAGAGLCFALYDTTSLMRRLGTYQCLVGCAEIGLGLALRLACRLAGSRHVMVAFTTAGVVECYLDRLGRPRGILDRGPVGPTKILSHSKIFSEVAVGAIRFHIRRRNESFAQWVPRNRPLHPATAPVPQN